MKTQKTNRDEVRANSLTILVTKEEKENINRHAEDMGISMSTFARLVLKDFMKKGREL